MFNLFNSPNNDNNEHLSILNQHGLPLKGWWAKYPKRAIEEIRIMASKTNASIKYEGDAIIWEEWIETNFENHFLISIETKDFPIKMPEVRILKPKIEGNLDYHMFDDGTICLMHQCNHNSRNSVLSYRNQAAAWCFAYEVFIHTGEFGAGEYEH